MVELGNIYKNPTGFHFHGIRDVDNEVEVINIVGNELTLRIRTIDGRTSETTFWDVSDVEGYEEEGGWLLDRVSLFKPLRKFNFI